ncbi:hypothetical protein AMJ85_10700 [candidate division BRC1 bacterium SM23_51]|nr:MAG: hypothetical protein AMJ85_10700 [candidate division BRC1 bacterium SM23_51]
MRKTILENGSVFKHFPLGAIGCGVSCGAVSRAERQAAEQIFSTQRFSRSRWPSRSGRSEMVAVGGRLGVFGCERLVRL